MNPGTTRGLLAITVLGHDRPGIIAEMAREGCMSVPDLTGDVRRAARLVVRGELPGTGDLVTISTDAFEARAVQHEIDHCQGLLFLDRAAGAHAVHARKSCL